MQDVPTPPAEGPLAFRAPLQALLNERRIGEAMDLCAKARAEHPQDPWLATMQAYLNLRLGRHVQAGEVAAEAIRLGSKDPLAVLVLGVSHRNTGRHREAADTLLAAHRLLPNHIDAAWMLIEETAAAYGLDRARALYAEANGALTHRRVATSWAQLLFRAGLDGELPAGFVSAPAMSIPDWMARAGAPLDFVGVREVIPIEQPVAFGAPPAPPVKMQVDGYVPYAATLRDATVSAKSNLVLMPDGAALNDTVADPRYGRFVSFEYDKAALDQRDGRVLLDVGQYQVAELDAGVMLSGSASEHFGHWIPEYLSKLSYLQHHPRFAELPIIVDSDMPAQHLQYLRLLAPNRIVQIPADGALRCRELVVASPATFFPVEMTRNHQVPPQNQGGCSPDGFRFIQARVLAAMPHAGPRERKLYLSRRNRGGRRPLNEDDVTAAMVARGFEVVFLENLPFEDQVRMFQAADVVVAPNGSSLMNVIFAARDVKVFVLSQGGLFNWGTYYGLMRELGYDMTFVCDDEETGQKHANYRVSLPRLIAALEGVGA